MVAAFLCAASMTWAESAALTDEEVFAFDLTMEHAESLENGQEANQNLFFEILSDKFDPVIVASVASWLTVVAVYVLIADGQKSILEHSEYDSFHFEV